MTVKTRFAPSPTGYLHIGGVRTALFCWLYSRRHGGKFVLRIEDTDRERSTEEAIQIIFDAMQWLELGMDEGPYYQTRRYDRYREVLERMLDEGHAYRCYCTRDELEAMRSEQLVRKEKPRYDGRCRERSDARPGVDPVFRFRNPADGEVVVDDLVRGRVVFRNAELDDLVLARADMSPTYNFSVIVDDSDMHITHVIRGDDHLNNTPRQINMLHALGLEPPQYAHVPLILGPDGSRLSKRHGAVSVLLYRQEGYLPEALLNYLVRLGWSHGDQEIFSLDEMIELFDIADVNKAAATFDPDKLLWLNQHYIMRCPADRLGRELGWQLERLGIRTTDGPPLEAVAAAQRERAKTLSEMARASRFFYEAIEAYDEKAARKNLNADTLPALGAARESLQALSEWDAASIHAAIHAAAERLAVGLGKIAQPIRVAVSGGAISPPIDVTLALLGRDTALARIDRAIAHIRSPATRALSGQPVRS
ncbi:MAG: glutamate--tRNA ligase [Gammaproteobacteria bacterium]|nr:glutamate--tRNA ligase [Gammaproteobacteria bacterium]